MYDKESVGYILLMCALIAAMVWFGWLRDSKLRYELQYDGADVYRDDKPKDCDFLTAPLGSKNCSYQKEVTVILSSKDPKTGEPIISYDNGKTWNPNPGGYTKDEYVYIRWKKVSD